MGLCGKINLLDGLCSIYGGAPFRAYIAVMRILVYLAGLDKHRIWMG